MGGGILAGSYPEGAGHVVPRWLPRRSEPRRPREPVHPPSRPNELL